MSVPIVVGDLVACALEARRPVVALETTVVTHGLPHPEGVAAALELESEILARGAMPATIGVLDGKIRVGLTRKEIERLARSGSTDPASGGSAPGLRTAAATGLPAVKLNPSNLAAGLASGQPGSTTVAATMFAAHRVGIEVFATGGIGGVHRGVAESGDVSADLMALARYPIAVVCAGAKAVLDLAKTVEMLETLAVPILGFGTGEFPAFYRRSSGLALDCRYDSMAELGRAVRLHFDLRLGTGLVIANPIPAENELPLELYEGSIASALAEAGRVGVRGRALTPFLLDRLRELTENESVFSNRALLVNNARVAAELAMELGKAK